MALGCEKQENFHIELREREVGTSAHNRGGVGWDREGVRGGVGGSKAGQLSVPPLPSPPLPPFLERDGSTAVRPSQFKTPVDDVDAAERYQENRPWDSDGAKIPVKC